MYEITYEQSTKKAIIGIIVAILYCIGIHYFLSFYFIHHTIITIVIVFLTLVAILRAVGIFAMYPGSFRYLAAQLEKTENDSLLYGIHQDMETINNLVQKIVSKDLISLKLNYHELNCPSLMSSLNTQLNALQKCQKPSPNKVRLVSAFKSLIAQFNYCVDLKDEQLQNINNKGNNWSEQNIPLNHKKRQQFNHYKKYQNSNKISLAMLVSDNTIILLFNNQKSFQNLKVAASNALKLAKKIWDISQSIAKIPTSQTQYTNIELDQFGNTEKMSNQLKLIDAHKFQIAGWHMFSQKLFTMSSFYAFWDNVLEYEVYMVPISKSQSIQCAIIHGQKNDQNTNDDQSKQQEPPSWPKRAVLFSNPNGGFVQTIALSSTYMKFYIKQGFQIILWNYRGYAKSNGIASITKSVQDVEKVYRFTQKKFNVKIEVLHGYSIGGVCVINLAHKLSNKQNNPIKLLVADRTFSSIDNVAYGFIKKKNIAAKTIKKIVKPLVRLLFSSECIDSADIYMKCKCNKVCIWDTKDLIITDIASLKYSIIKHVKNQSKSQVKKQNQLKQQSQIHLQQISINISLIAQKFGEAVSTIYQKDYRIYEKIMKILYDTDAGGNRVFLKQGHYVDDTTSLSHCKKSIKNISIKYLISMFLYGPKLCLPYRVFQSDKKLYEWIHQRLSKRIQLIQKQIKKLSQQQCQKNNKQFEEIIKSLNYVRNYLCLDNQKKNRLKYGHLIVSEVGHNNDLKQQYAQLQNILRNSLIETQVASKNQKILK